MPKRRIMKMLSDNEDEDSQSGHSSNEPPQRNAANARERARMRVLSKAFSRLKTILPWVPADTKLSKLDTLRLASKYIAHLQSLLQEETHESIPCPACPHPFNMAWPFSFHHHDTGIVCNNHEQKNMHEKSYSYEQLCNNNISEHNYIYTSYEVNCNSDNQCLSWRR